VAKMHKYAIEIFYSEEDEGYIAAVPELPAVLLLVKLRKRLWKRLK
jgi:hypothetical protein